MTLALINAAISPPPPPGAPSNAGSGAGSGLDDFGSALSNALQGAVATGTEAEAGATGALNGQGDITAVVAAVTRADMALQTVTSIRDRFVQAYQDVLHMSI